MGVMRTAQRASAIMRAKKRRIGGDTPASIAADFKSRVTSDGGVVEGYDCLIARIQDLKDKGIWNSATAVWMPHGYKEDKLYAVKGGAGADLGFSRNGTRTRKGPTYVEQVPYNLLSRSEEFDDAAWTKGTLTATANSITAPDGTLTGYRLLCTAGTTAKRISQSFSSLSGGEIFIVFYVKNDTQGTIQIYLTGNSVSFCNYDLVNGTVNASSATAGMEDAGAGWWKCTFACSGDAPTGFFMQAVTGLSSARNQVVSTENAWYLWRTQLVYGAVEKNYFKTTDRFNVPALDYTNDTCPALSLEPSRANLLLRSEEFDNASWSKTTTTVTANALIGVDGLQTADRLLETAVNNDHSLYQSVSKAASALTYTASIYAKPNGRDWFEIQIDDGAGNGYKKWFNITTGVLGTTTATGTGWTFVEAKIVQDVNRSTGLPTGWYRCIVTTTSNTATIVRVIFRPANGDGTDSYLGDITKGIDLDESQLEQGSYATSYIPTTSATVTRIADTVNALTGVSSLIGQTEGTLYFEVESPVDGTSKIIAISDNSTSNVIRINVNSSNRLVVYVASGGVSSVNGDVGINWESDTTYKIAIRYSANGVSVDVNGVKMFEDLTAVIPSCSVVAFSSSSNNFPWYGSVNVLAIYKTVLTDAQAIALTTP